jgi:hypothetical protein
MLIIVAEIEAEKTCTSGSETQLQEPRPLSTISAVRSGPTHVFKNSSFPTMLLKKSRSQTRLFERPDTEPRCAEDSVAPTMIESVHVD